MMRWWHELKYLIRKLDRNRAEQELEDEIRAHLEIEAQERQENCRPAGIREPCHYEGGLSHHLGIQTDRDFVARRSVWLADAA
jgi:hypothetical protein